MITGLITMCALSLPAQLPPARWAAFHARQAEEDRQAEKKYMEMLPFMLENQRQMLQYQSDWERNQALNRIAAAVENQNRRRSFYYSNYPRLPSYPSYYNPYTNTPNYLGLLGIPQRSW